MLKTLIPEPLRPGLRVVYSILCYAGSRYRCPFCGAHLRRFRTFGFEFPVLKELEVVGAGRRAQALCPFCRSLDRERLLYFFLLHKTNIFTTPMKVLHVAPEAQVSKVLSNHKTIDYLTADLQSQHVMVKMDITAIQFPANHFDAIICNHVLEHVPDDRKAMAELCRVLAPGGWAILQVPMSLRLDRTYEDSSITTTAAREAAFGQHDHVRIYARDYTDRLVQAGFTIDVFYWTKEAQHFGERKNRYGLNEKEGIYFATKPVA